jgi:PAS domain S-box-containing protein
MPQGIRKMEADHKQAGSALKEMVTRYRTLFEAANDAIFLMKEVTFVECNAKTLEIFGCSQHEEIVEKAVCDFSPERQPDGSLSRELSRKKVRLAEEGKAQFFEWRHKQLDGTLFDTEISLNRMRLSGETYLLAIA